MVVSKQRAKCGYVKGMNNVSICVIQPQAQSERCLQLNTASRDMSDTGQVV